jgi:CheY-like chemotaxis protein
MDGISVLKQIRADTTLNQLTVIAVTAHVMKHYEERYRAAGFDDVISKPIVDVDGFYERVKKAMTKPA